VENVSRLRAVAGKAGLGALQWAVSGAILYVVWTRLLEPHFSEAFFAGPHATWDRLVEFQRDGTLTHMVSVTMKEALAGFVIGTGLGVVLALVIGLTPDLVGKVFEPVVAGLYAVPKFVFVPVLFVWMGSGFLPRMYLVTVAVFPVVTIYLVSGIRTVDAETMQALRLFGASRAQLGRKLLLPHAMSYLVTALVFVLPHAFTFAIGTEILFGGSDGIGGVMFGQSQSFNSAGVLAALAVGTALSAVFVWLARSLTPRLLGRVLGHGH
jgi:NitT/TauT family transport system permease protein